MLVVTDTLTGGQGAAAVNHARWFAAHGWNVAVAAPPDEPDRVEPPNLHPIPLPKTARDVRGIVRAARAIRQTRRSINADVVHCHGARSFAAARLAGPAYVTLHGVSEVSSDPRGYSRVRRAGLRIVPHLATRAFSVRPEVPPNWEFTPHASDRLATMDRLGPPTAPTPTFLWVGRLDEPKRPDLFIQAMAALGTGRGLIAGSGPMADDLARLIEATRAPVELLGHRGDIAELLEQAWAVVMLSDHEGVSFAIEEAMWAGRAVVSSPTPGLTWLVGDAGALVGNVTEAVAALKRLCQPGTAAAEGERAAARIRTLLRPDDPWPLIAKAYG